MRRTLFLLPVLSTLLFPLAAQAESYLVVSTCGVLPRTPSLGSADGPIGIDQTGKLCVNSPPSSVTVATPLDVRILLPAQVVSGAFNDGALTTEGSVADATYGGSGSATINSVLKGIYNAVKNLTVTTTIATPLAVTITNTPVNVTFATPIAVTQSTSPWVVTGNALVTQGTTPWQVAFNPQSVNQGTSPWIVSGTTLQGTIPWNVNVTQIVSPVVVSPNNITPVSQSTIPWVVSANSLTPVTQSTVPWVVNVTQIITPLAVTQSTSPWITQENAANTERVNPSTSSQWGLVVTGAAPIATAVEISGVVSSTEAPKGTANQIGTFFLDLVGKLITSPYAGRENYVTGAVSTSGITVAAIIATPVILSYSNYITDFACTRSDLGTTAITVTTNDTNTAGVQGAAVWTLPNNGGGGGFMKSFQVPLKVAAGTAFQIKPQQSVSFLYCNANGYIGY